MHAALIAEVTSREAALGARGAATGAEAGPPDLLAILRAATGTHDFLSGMLSDLERYTALGETLAGKSRFVLELAEKIRLFALNALLASAWAPTAPRWARSRSSCAAARTRWGRPSRRCPRTSGARSGFSGTSASGVGVAKLQTEMLTVFVRELLEHEDAGHDVAHDRGTLSRALESGASALFASLDALDRRLRTILRHAHELDADLDVIRALEVNGRLEAARAVESDAVEALFREVGEQVGVAREEMAEFRGVDDILRHRRPREESHALGQVALVAERVATLG